MAAAPSMRPVFEAAKAATVSSLPKDSWYIIAATSLLAGRGSHHYGELYAYALSDLGADASREDCVRLTARFYEVAMKAWTLVGVPSVISAWYSLREVVKMEHIVHNTTRQDIASDPAFRATRAKTWFSQVFAEEENRIFGGFEAFPEFEWALKDVVYGSFLSDLSILGPVENEIVVLACVATQGARSPVLSHYKGLRRVGTSKAEAASVGNVIQIMAHGLGIDTRNWYTSRDVESYFNDSPSPVL